jgi:fructokinase
MIVVCGEALMDVFQAGTTRTGLALDARIGGSPYNMALGLARLGQPVAFCGAVSSGSMGERLMQSMADEGINTACVQRLDAPCSVCVVGLDAEGVPRYDFHGANGADRQLNTDVLQQLPAQVSALQLGSYAMVVEPVAATQRAIVAHLQSRTVVAYDPNVRLVVEPSVQRWRDALEWMLPRTHLLKVSEEDLQLLCPAQSLDALAALWLAQGVKLVVVTRGGAGAMAWHASGSAHVASRSVRVVDTVGAGDTFQAALLTWLSEQGRLSVAGLSSLKPEHTSAALEFASQAAAITCSRRGADLPIRSEVMGTP